MAGGAPAPTGATRQAGGRVNPLTGQNPAGQQGGDLMTALQGALPGGQMPQMQPGKGGKGGFEQPGQAPIQQYQGPPQGGGGGKGGF